MGLNCVIMLLIMAHSSSSGAPTFYHGNDTIWPELPLLSVFGEFADRMPGLPGVGPAER